MGKSNTGKTAVWCTFAAFLFLLTAFTTPNWLQTDGKITEPKFLKIGLWRVCFNGFQDTRHVYNTQFHGCSWVFEEKNYIIHNFLLPPFFVITQFFFTLCMTLLLIGALLATLYTFCSNTHKKYQLLLWITGVNLTLAAACSFIAVIIFGFNGDDRDWMPNWEHNDIGWSYYAAVIGSFILITAGILFLIEARRLKKKLKKLFGEEMKNQNVM